MCLANHGGTSAGWTASGCSPPSLRSAAWGCWGAFARWGAGVSGSAIRPSPGSTLLHHGFPAFEAPTTETLAQAVPSRNAMPPAGWLHVRSYGLCARTGDGKTAGAELDVGGGPGVPRSGLVGLGGHGFLRRYQLFSYLAG